MENVVSTEDQWRGVRSGGDVKNTRKVLPCGEPDGRVLNARVEWNTMKKDGECL